jgi:hypothetical protein
VRQREGEREREREREGERGTSEVGTRPGGRRVGSWEGTGWTEAVGDRQKAVA